MNCSTVGFETLILAEREYVVRQQRGSVHRMRKQMTWFQSCSLSGFIHHTRAWTVHTFRGKPRLQCCMVHWTSRDKILCIKSM
jgi:hypothetical protein